MKSIRLLILSALGATSLALAETAAPPAMNTGAFGSTTTGTREFTLGASGSTDRRISGSNGGASGSFGWYLNELSEIVVRQSFNFSTGDRTLVPTTGGGGATN